MNVLTISREYGAGGGELARHLASALGWDLLDQELLHRAAAVEQMPDAEWERLDEKPVGLADRLRLHPPAQRYIHGITEAARQAAARGRVILVGRGTRHLVGDMADALHLRLIAPLAWRAQRMARLQGWSVAEAEARCREIDRSRERFTRYFFGPQALQPEQYDLVVNTGRVLLEDVANWLRALIQHDKPPTDRPTTGRRIITLTWQHKSLESDLSAELAARLGLRRIDPSELDRQLEAAGIPSADVARLEEPAAGWWRRFRHRQLRRRYVEVVGRLVREWAQNQDVLLVSPDAHSLLRDHPRAHHARLVAPWLVRVRRVMAERWWKQGPAEQFLLDRDQRCERFCQSCFGSAWSDPLNYHLTVNAARLGKATTDVLVWAADRQWRRQEETSDGR
ncbi:MAG: cytidylate kinase-like family protein [Gemmataceae bacterium]|nr:cytidylate kinase-like family protein [Gemmataceae bacterium]MDW8267454.1 cytidylate kinase family protein [Gemmataceae bacterium]